MDTLESLASSKPSKQGREREKSVLKLALFIGALAAIIFAVKITGLDGYLDKESLQAAIGRFGPWGPLVFILIYAVSPSLFLPGLPLTVVAGLAFGPLFGILYTIIGATMGASIAFLVARYFARAQVEQLLTGKMKAIDEGVNEKGWAYVAITRLIPLFPFNLLNYAFGLTGIKFSHYAVASFVFMLPGTAAYVVFSSSLLDVFKGNLSSEFIVGLLLIVTVSMIPLLYKRLKRQLVPDE